MSKTDTEQLLILYERAKKSQKYEEILRSMDYIFGRIRAYILENIKFSGSAKDKDIDEKYKLWLRRAIFKRFTIDDLGEIMDLLDKSRLIKDTTTDIFE
ncbi:MAG: hypothetical protein IJ545_04885 [Alphaproteobacteria bacterium]|nr:hypothetical protein [Alphaproteobacteria bacterium]